MIHTILTRNAQVLIVAAVALSAVGCDAGVRTGLDNVHLQASLFGGKRVGIVTNHTAYDRTGRHIVEVFQAMPGVEVTALFGPEHGIYGLAEAGVKVADEKDERFRIPVYSLYGKTAKPTAEMLKDVDVLVFDIQDIGARFYTYIHTMAYAMEAAAENNKPFVVLDRPNPINGVTVQGNILENDFATFVGLYPIPVRHGMTVGELARMFNDQGWLKHGVKANLTVVPIQGWRRDMWYDRTGLKFRKPSPNMPNLKTATVYPGLCLLEGTNISEGRGTNKPFLQFGAPWIDSKKLANELNRLNLRGIRFEPVSFTPTFSKHKGQLCRGAEIIITDRDRLESYSAGIKIVNTLYKMCPDRFEWRQRHFDRLCGTASIRNAIIAGKSIDELKTGWQGRLGVFLKIRKSYLLYR